TGPRSRHARSRGAACTRLAGAGRAGLYASCGDRTTAAACVHAGAMCTRIDDALTAVVGGVTRMGKMGEDIAVVAGSDGGNYRVPAAGCASDRAYSLAPPAGGASRGAPHGTVSALSRTCATNPAIMSTLSISHARSSVACPEPSTSP